MMVCLKLVVRDVFSSIIIEGFRKIKFSGCVPGVPAVAQNSQMLISSVCYFYPMTEKLDKAKKPSIVMEKKMMNCFCFTCVISRS